VKINLLNKTLDGNYWSNRYKNNDAVWDLGAISTPIKTYVDQLVDKNISILIMGCGNAHEADYLLEKGFTDITLIDIAPALVENLQLKFASFPPVKVILGDFFDLNHSFDLILEQTLFCAIDPTLRSQYVHKIDQILTPSGTLGGVMFNKIFPFEGPPFGGSIAEYSILFAPLFSIKVLTECYNSVASRKGNEAFIILKRKP
jgi:hypothetical protein